MRLRLIAILLGVTSCWTSASVPPAAPATEERPAATPHRALASQLADLLRDPEDSMFVDRFVDGQLVVLELDLGAIQVLCNAQTLSASVRFSELLNDPDRPPATCAPSASGVTCTQGMGADRLSLDFVREDDAWRLLGGILPRGPATSTGDTRALVRDYRARIAVPACPP